MNLKKMGDKELNDLRNTVWEEINSRNKEPQKEIYMIEDREPGSIPQYFDDYEYAEKQFIARLSPDSPRGYTLRKTLVSERHYATLIKRGILCIY